MQYRIEPNVLLHRYTVKQLFFMFREAVAYRTGKKTEGDIADEKKNSDFDFIMDDNTEQVVDFVKEEKDRYLWDDHRKEWYIPFEGHVRYTANYPVNKYRKDK